MIDLTGALTDRYYAGYRDYFASLERIGYYIHDTVSLIDPPTGTYSWSHWNGNHTVIDKAFSDIDPHVDLDFYRTTNAAEAQIHIYRVSPYPGMPGDILGMAYGSDQYSLAPSAGSQGRFQTVIWTDYKGGGNPFLIDENGYDYGITTWQDANTMIHEIGHSLGLSHPQSNGNDDPRGEWHNSSSTIMSYNSDIKYDQWGLYAYAPSWSSDDIATLQSIWGTENGNNDHPTNNSDVITGTSSADTFYLFRGDDKAYAGWGNDIVYGGEGNDEIYGNQGEDVLYGNFGEDTIYAGKGKDLVYGGKHRDYLYGNMQDDVIYGNKGDDVIYGGQDNDTLWGGDGNDWLDGNRDNDRLIGGFGADRFILSYGLDTIADFNPSEGDRVVLGSGEYLYASLTDQANGLLISVNGKSAIIEGWSSSNFNWVSHSTQLPA